MQPLLSIVVPCFNEAESIPHIVTAFNAISIKYNFIEVILVNNGSTDNTSSILNKQAINSVIKIITVPQNKGYGYGILQGLNACTAPVLAWTHSDLQTDPADVIKAYFKYMQFNNEMLLVKGKRCNRNRLDVFFTWGMQMYTQWQLKVNLTDINAQPKLFSRFFFDQIKYNAPLDFSLDLYWFYKAQKLGAVETIEVQFLKRKFGEAKGGGTFKGKVKLIKRTMAYIKQLKKQL